MHSTLPSNCSLLVQHICVSVSTQFKDYYLCTSQKSDYMLQKVMPAITALLKGQGVISVAVCVCTVHSGQA